MLTAQEALEHLRKGNLVYQTALVNPGDVSPRLRKLTAENGQTPYAIILCCSDSREIPEAIFSAGIGELFVIRVAGNVIDEHQLGSVEYAAEHLGCRLVVVLGHDGCGAVAAALRHDPDGHIRFITNDILSAIGAERDEYRAACLNAIHSARLIREDNDIRKLESDGLKVIPAIYHLKDGSVRFLEEAEGGI